MLIPLLFGGAAIALYMWGRKSSAASTQPGSQSGQTATPGKVPSEWKASVFETRSTVIDTPVGAPTYPAQLLQWWKQDVATMLWVSWSQCAVEVVEISPQLKANAPGTKGFRILNRKPVAASKEISAQQVVAQAAIQKVACLANIDCMLPTSETRFLILGPEQIEVGAVPLSDLAIFANSKTLPAIQSGAQSFTPPASK